MSHRYKIIYANGNTTTVLDDCATEALLCNQVFGLTLEEAAEFGCGVELLEEDAAMPPDHVEEGPGDETRPDLDHGIDENDDAETKAALDAKLAQELAEQEAATKAAAEAEAAAAQAAADAEAAKELPAEEPSPKKKSSK